MNNNQYATRKEEAVRTLGFWLNIANSNLSDENINFNDAKEKINGALDMLEGMILIYNVFADEKLEINFNENTYLYELIE